MRSNKISLIIMKDEGRTHRLRLSPQSLSIIAGLLLLTPILFAGSVWLNFYLYKERSIIAKKQVELQYTVDKNYQTTARLTNLEQFLRDHSPSLLGLLVSQSNVDTMLIPRVGSKDKKLADELNKLAMKPIDTTTEIGTKINDLNEKNTVASDEKVQNTEPIKTELIPAQDAEENINVTVPPKIVNAEKQNIDLGYVMLQNVYAQRFGNTIKIQYYLRNTGKDIPLVGDQKYTLIDMKDGEIERTELPNATNDNFRIRSLKIVESSISLPKNAITPNARIQVAIMRNGTILFREEYPITR